MHWWWGQFAWKAADLGKAQGDVHVGQDQRLGLVLGPQGWRDLSYLCQLAPDDLELLQLKCKSRLKPGDAGLRQICTLAGLKTLFLQDAGVTNEGLAALGKLRSLERLCIQSEQLDASGIAHLADMASLSSLRLSTGNIISSVALSHLAKLTSLKELYIGWQGLENAGLAHLSTLPALEFLSISAKEIGPADLQPLENLAQLTRLRLFTSRGEDFPVLPDMPLLTELYARKGGPEFISLTKLAQLSGLESLSLTGRFTDEGLAQLSPLIALKEIQLQPLFQDRGFITDETLAQLGKHACLERIRIYTGQFTDKGLAHLAALPHLRQLHIPNNQGFTDAGLKHLAKLTNLEDLYLRGRLFTHTGTAELTGLKQLRIVKFLTPSADAAAFSRTHGQNK